MARTGKDVLLRKETEAVELHLAGMPYEQIAERIGYRDGSGAYKAVRRALSRRVTTASDEVVESSLARCDRMLTAWWPRALAGDAKAALVVERWETRRAKLLGLDAPVRVSATLTSELDAEITQLVEQLAGLPAAPDAPLPAAPVDTP
jgi:hypothetical protein